MKKGPARGPLLYCYCSSRSLRGVWQGSRLAGAGEFALLGTTMAPGFDPADYEHGDREELIRAFPEARDLITALTRGQ